jgi:hypothetical protein
MVHALSVLHQLQTPKVHTPEVSQYPGCTRVQTLAAHAQTAVPGSVPQAVQKTCTAVAPCVFTDSPGEQQGISDQA